MRKRRWGLVLGAGVTLSVIAGYLGGPLVAIERSELDWGFRRFNRIEADPRITLIDINDHALQQIGRWPWPRRLQADLVNVLSECGAKAILLDLVYAEPQPPRIERPELDAAQRYDPALEVLGSVSLRDAVYDDEELADAIARAGNVYVAMFFPLSEPDDDPLARRARARELLAAEPDVSASAFAAALGIESREVASTLLLDARIDAVLLHDFRATASKIAARLNVEASEIEERLARAKRTAAENLVERELAAHPEATFDAVVAAIMPGASPQRQSRDREDLVIAYAHTKAEPFAFASALPDGERFRGVAACGGDCTLPIELIAAAAKRVGFVNFEKDDDGVLRHVPPVANLSNRAVLQIAFSLAVDVLDIDAATIAISDDGAIEFTTSNGDRRWRLPLNGAGQLMLNWHIERAAPAWNHSFAHVPAARVMEIASNRRTMVHNEDLLRARREEAVAFMLEGAESAYLDYEGAVRKLRSSLLAGDADWAPQREAVEAVERRAIAHVEQLAAEIEGLQPQDDEERALFARIEALQKKANAGDTSEHIAELNATLRARNEQLLVELRERIGGKLCFVGHTAAAQADMVNTPVFENMPGVMAHANLANMMLVNRIPTVAPRSLNVALILISGVIATVLTSGRGPWAALISVGALMVVLLAASALLVYAQAFFIAAWIPAGGVFVTWALITLYRQLTEQRQRRSFARELARNTSPAIAARITEQLDSLDLTPQPADVTCYFSDLQGFTTISERLGVEQTQTILNRYLAAMAEVLIGHRAFNKFMGDGIFAFFNAPIWPEEHHAVVGCEAALATRDRLAELIAGADPSLREVYGALRMRIGVHTGPVFVGYFGSEHQSDYTCIGDTVNLAARLESANKAFGTLLMVSGVCREIAGDRYAYRHLGALQVKGKAQAVPVFELLGRAGEVEDVTIRYAERFGQAVEAFQERRWVDARSAFCGCGEQRPEDDAVRLYLAQITAYEATPPPDDWNRAIELTTK